MKGVILSPEAQSGVYALIALVTDPSVAKAALDELVAAKDAADERIAEAAKREQAAAEHEAFLFGAQEKLKTDQDALAKIVSEKAAEVKKLAEDRSAHSERASKWEVTRQGEGIALGRRETDVAAAEAKLVGREEVLVAREQAADDKEAKYVALLSGAAKLLGG